MLYDAYHAATLTATNAATLTATGPKKEGLDSLLHVASVQPAMHLVIARRVTL